MAEIQMDVTGVPMVLNITNLELAKFIGTKKGGTGVQAASDQEAGGSPHGEELAGS